MLSSRSGKARIVVRRPEDVAVLWSLEEPSFTKQLAICKLTADYHSILVFVFCFSLSHTYIGALPQWQLPTLPYNYNFWGSLAPNIAVPPSHLKKKLVGDHSLGCCCGETGDLSHERAGERAMLIPWYMPQGRLMIHTRP